MKLADTHSHIYSNEFKDDLEQVIQRAKESGVYKIFLPSTEEESVCEVLKTFGKDKSFFVPMAGLYPGSVNAEVEKQLSAIKTYLNNPEIKGIGEIGLDFYWNKDFEQEQLYAFKTQMQWSIERDYLPVSVHCRKAFKETLDILKEINSKKYNGVFHCFSGDIFQAEKVIEMGFMLGIGGVVTFKNSHLKEIVKQIDLANIVLETDSPYLAPVPMRGKRNESSYIEIIARQVADIKGVSVEQVAEQTSYNAERLLLNSKRFA